MEVLGLLLSVKMKMWRAALLDRSKDALIRNISTGVVLAALLWSAYRFFYGFIFSYVASIEEIGFLLIDRLVSTGFLAFFIMLVISSFISAVATLFRSDETEYLFSTPASELALFTGRFIDTIVLSSWAILVMALPIFIAYARVRHFGIREYLLAGLFVLPPFVLTAASIGTLLALVAVVCSKRIGLRWFSLAGGAVFAGLVYVFIAFSRPTEMRIPFNEDFRALNLFINNFHMNSHPLTPNFWLVQGLGALDLHRYREFLVYVAALASSAFFAVMAVYVAADRFFFGAWLLSGEESTSRIDAGSKTRRFALTISPSSSQTRALFTKDAVLFLRDPSQWSQLLLIIALLALYFFNLRLVPVDIEIEKWRTIIAMMNFGFAGFVLATLAVRFIYPSISLEGQSIWVPSSAPVAPAVMFREKFLSSCTVFLVIAEPLAILSGYFLRLDALHMAVTAGGVLLMSITLSCVAVGFGAAFPSFQETDPSRIASSPGGILTIAVSLGYIGVMTALVAAPLTVYTAWLVSGGRSPAPLAAVCALLMIVLNGGLIAFTLRLGSNALKRREF